MYVETRIALMKWSRSWLDGKCCTGFLLGELEQPRGGLVVTRQRGPAEHHQRTRQSPWTVVADVTARRHRLADAVQSRRRARIDVVGDDVGDPSHDLVGG